MAARRHLYSVSIRHTMQHNMGLPAETPVTRFAPLDMIYMASDWICYFGYGSLVNRDTRPAGEVAHAARLWGWQRVWEHRVAGSPSRQSCTSLSIEPDAGPASSSIEGMVVSMPCAHLSQLDEREAGYERLELPATQFDLPDHLEHESVIVYRSKPENRKVADQDHPVLQSYVDCVLAGYRQNFDESGVHTFVSSTRGWEGGIFNDRDAPRYPRWVEVAVERQMQFDAVVQQYQTLSS